MNRPENGKKLI